ncbi:16588_t:CDS:2, partial [Racocetra fulgida]
GWSSSLRKSIYVFVVITSNRKQYIYSLVDESANFIQVLILIDSKKFVAVVSDAESAMQLAKQIISTKYPYILPIRYIAHHINFITSHIIKLDFTKAVFK